MRFTQYIFNRLMPRDASECTFELFGHAQIDRRGGQDLRSVLTGCFFNDKKSNRFGFIGPIDWPELPHGCIEQNFGIRGVLHNICSSKDNQ